MGSSKPREVDLEGNRQESGSPWQLNSSQGNRREEMPVAEETGKRLNSSSVGNQAEVKVAEQRAPLPREGSRSRDYHRLGRAQREGSRGQPS